MYTHIHTYVDTYMCIHMFDFWIKLFFFVWAEKEKNYFNVAWLVGWSLFIQIRNLLCLALLTTVSSHENTYLIFRI